MRVYHDLESLTSQITKSAIALGTFDGVHLGHKKIIGEAVHWAKTTGQASVVFTFSNHPFSILAPDRCPPQIVDQDYKAFLISQLDVDFLLTIPFTDYFSRLSSEEFIKMLTKYLKPDYVVIGPNYSFGYKGTGTPAALHSAGKNLGFTVNVHDAVYVDNILVSSTTIRELIAKGDVKQASRLLGRHFSITGKVIEGDKRGRSLGFPTANLDIPQGLVAVGDGVYAAMVLIGTSYYRGIVNVGDNPTFKANKRRIEVHLLELSGNIYGLSVTIEFIERLRDEMKFNSQEELIEQIKLDIEKAGKYLNMM